MYDDGYYNPTYYYTMTNGTDTSDGVDVIAADGTVLQDIDFIDFGAQQPRFRPILRQRHHRGRRRRHFVRDYRRGVGCPEPSTLALLGIGAVSLFAFAWRKYRAVLGLK